MQKEKGEKVLSDLDSRFRGNDKPSKLTIWTALSHEFHESTRIIF
jgi:hypothetical protein